jgi:hypothetical protein
MGCPVGISNAAAAATYVVMLAVALLSLAAFPVSAYRPGAARSGEDMRLRRWPARNWRLLCTGTGEFYFASVALWFATGFSFL